MTKQKSFTDEGLDPVAEPAHLQTSLSSLFILQTLTFDLWVDGMWLGLWQDCFQRQSWQEDNRLVLHFDGAGMPASVAELPGTPTRSHMTLKAAGNCWVLSEMRGSLANIGLIWQLAEPRLTRTMRCRTPLSMLNNHPHHLLLVCCQIEKYETCPPVLLTNCPFRSTYLVGCNIVYVSSGHLNFRCWVWRDLDPVSNDVIFRSSCEHTRF